LLLTGTAAASVMTGVNLRTRRAYLAALEDRAARLEKEKDQQAQLAVATERTRIAREVHDIVTHSLSVMVALADGAAAAGPSSPVRAGQVMGQVAATGRQAIGEMRRLVGTLRIDETGADHHPAPGIGQLDDLLTQARSAGLPAGLVVEGRLHQLTQGAQLAVYRVVQESLTNIRKHAHAVTGVTVRLEYTSEGIEVCITDDGQPAGSGEPTAGHGITGMRERVAGYDGTVEAGPFADGGWRVRARLNAGRSEEQ
jgi:signal transduction histidine kinase